MDSCGRLSAQAQQLAVDVRRQEEGSLCEQCSSRRGTSAVSVPMAREGVEVGMSKVILPKGGSEFRGAFDVGNSGLK